eukprot:463180-Amorphochlora_amoeboformis.AAC.1
MNSVAQLYSRPIVQVYEVRMDTRTWIITNLEESGYLGTEFARTMRTSRIFSKASGKYPQRDMT